MKTFMSCLLAFIGGCFNFKAIFRGPLFAMMGAIPGAPGTVDHSNDSGDKRIPQLFSRTYRKKFYDEVCVANITNTDHTGELKGLGGQVVINTIPDVVIGDYYRGKQRQWQQCSSPPVIMTVSRGSDFAVVVDDADKAQMWDKDFLGTLSKDAMKKQKIKVDTEFFANIYPNAHASNVGTAAGKKTGATAAIAGPGYNMGVAGTPRGINKVNAIEAVFDAESVGDEQTWPDDERWIVLPTWYKNALALSDYKDESVTGKTSTLNGGRIGTIGKFKTYATNLLPSIADASGKTCFPVIFGHISANAFVSQLANVKYFNQLESTNGAGLAGENIYDWMTIYPDAMGVLYCYFNR